MDYKYGAARAAMSRYDMATAFGLLLPPSLKGDAEARRLLATIADSFEMLFNVPEASFAGVKDAADGGNAFAQYLMARYHHVKRVDINEEVRYAKMSAEQDDGAGMYVLSQCYADGRGMARNKEKAEELRLCAIEKEHPAAMLQEAWARFVPWNKDKDEARGMQLLRRCMELDIPESYTIMAKLCCWEKSCVPTEVEEGKRLFMRAANEGYPQAYNGLACEIYWGIGNGELDKLFENTMHEGMAHGVPACYYNMAQRFFIKKDTQKAVEWYKQAAERGYMAAYAVLGGLYLHGNCVEMDLQEAWKWYSREADLYAPDCLKGICGMIEPCSLSMIIRPADEETNPYDEWFKGKSPNDIVVYKERLAMTGLQGAADAAVDLYNMFRSETLESSELLHILNHGETGHKWAEKNDDRAMGYLRRAVEIDCKVEDRLRYGLLVTEAGSAYCDVAEGILQLEKVLETNDVRQKPFAVFAALRLAEMYDSGVLMKRDADKVKRYRQKALMAGYEASKDPIVKPYYESPARYAREQYGVAFLEEARQAMRRLDVGAAYGLLLEPSLNSYHEAQSLMVDIVDNEKNIQDVPDKMFDEVKVFADHSDGFSAYMMAC